MHAHRLIILEFSMQVIWNDLLTEQDRAVIVQAGYAAQGASLWDSRRLGRYPALLIVDMQEMLIGQDLPILQAIADSHGVYRLAGHAIYRSLCRNDPPGHYSNLLYPGHTARSSGR